MDFASCFKLWTLRSELKSGFLLLGCFSPAFSVLGLLLMLFLGLKYLQIAWHGKGFIQFFYAIKGKSGDTNIGVCSKLVFSEVFDSKFVPFFEKSKSRKESKTDPNDDEGSDFCAEDEEFDVISLRRMVKIERFKAEMAYSELEKERMASATAANEAMAMISRLQFEKSSIEIEANQFRRMAEQQKAYDEELIQSLQWTIMSYESQRDELVNNLKFCEQKLNLLMTTDELDDFDLDSNLEDEAVEEDSSIFLEAAEDAKKIMA